VKFGDGSVIDIEGHGTILFIGNGGEHHRLSGVYLMPRLKSNIVSLGQLDEGGCLIYIEWGFLKIRDSNRHFLTKVRHMANRMYILELNIVQLVCYLSKTKETSWRWHGRYGHLNFPVL
jgi:hypothetical protein